MSVNALTQALNTDLFDHKHYFLIQKCEKMYLKKKPNRLNTMTNTFCCCWSFLQSQVKKLFKELLNIEFGLDELLNTIAQIN